MRSVNNRSHQQDFCVLVKNKGALHSPYIYFHESSNLPQALL